MNDRKAIMTLGWVWGILGLPPYLVRVADACLSMHGPWWLFFGTAAVFAWWAYLLLTAFVAPCPFKHAMNRTAQMAYAMFMARRAGADLHVTNKRNGDMHITYTLKPCEPGKLTEVWE